MPFETYTAPCIFHSTFKVGDSAWAGDQVSFRGNCKRKDEEKENKKRSETQKNYDTHVDPQRVNEPINLVIHRQLVLVVHNQGAQRARGASLLRTRIIRLFFCQPASCNADLVQKQAENASFVLDKSQKLELRNTEVQFYLIVRVLLCEVRLVLVSEGILRLIGEPGDGQ